MIERPERFVAAFAAAGANSISVHIEATPHIHYALKEVREVGCKAGLALNPGTPPHLVQQLVGSFDLLLCMTVNPGWGGQAFIEGSEDKVRALRALTGEGTPIEVDGGIDPETARSCAAAGATLFVAGSSVFRQADPAEAYTEIASAAGAV